MTELPVEPGTVKFPFHQKTDGYGSDRYRKEMRNQCFGSVQTSYLTARSRYVVVELARSNQFPRVGLRLFRQLVSLFLLHLPSFRIDSLALSRFK